MFTGGSYQGIKSAIPWYTGHTRSTVYQKQFLLGIILQINIFLLCRKKHETNVKGTCFLMYGMTLCHSRKKPEVQIVTYSF